MRLQTWLDGLVLSGHLLAGCSAVGRKQTGRKRRRGPTALPPPVHAANECEDGEERNGTPTDAKGFNRNVFNRN